MTLKFKVFFWEAQSYSASFEAICILLNQNVHYCVYSSIPLVPILRQINPHLLHNLACVRSQTPLEINFIFRQKRNYWIFNTRWIIAVYFPHNATNFIVSSFSVQIILMFFINHVLIFKYPSWQDNGWIFFLRSLGGMRLSPFVLQPLWCLTWWMNEWIWSTGI